MSDIERAISQIAYAYDNGEIPGTLPHDASPIAKVMQMWADERAHANDLADAITEYLDGEFGLDRGLHPDNFPPGHDILVLALIRHQEARK